MRLCGSDLADGGICFTPLSLTTGECRTADAHTPEPLSLAVIGGTDHLTHTRSGDAVAPLPTEQTDETPIQALELVQA